jgi:hypothetical protein
LALFGGNMILKKLSMVAVLAAALGTFACKSDCEKLCEQQLECDPDDSPLGVQQEDDCSDDCEEYEEQIDAADCNDYYDDVVACVDGLDVCDADDIADCAEEYADLLECIADYCSVDDPEDLPPECD